LFKIVCVGAIYFGILTTFNVSNCTFTNCSANNGGDGAYGGAIYSNSSAGQLKYIINITFITNVASSGNGNDIADGSTVVQQSYTSESVYGCTSTSSSVRFYGVANGVSLDCLLIGECTSSYYYVSLAGTDFQYCGVSNSHCLTLVCYFYVIIIIIFFFFFLLGLCFINSHRKQHDRSSQWNA
jgi:hypothetical protein